MTDSTVDQSVPPLVQIDPAGTDRHGEAARMRELGPVVRVELPGGVRMWMVTDYKLLAELAADSRVGRDWRQWTALQRGEVPGDWPLLSMIRLNNAMARDGAEHKRLRRPLTRTFTRNRVERLRPRIDQIVATMLDDLPNHVGSDSAVDLRRHYAYPFPMQVICELIGVPEAWWPLFRQLIDTVVRADTTAEEYKATQQKRHEMWQRLFAMRRAEPADDLTSAMIAANEEDDDALTDEELEDTLWMLIGAGHETSISLIVNATRALLIHPEQLAKIRNGNADSWSLVIEETLRWDAPVGNFPARFPTEDVTVAGVTIHKGDAILAPWSGVNRDPSQYGMDADRFDISRQPQRHMAFGTGPHTCIGPALARLEASAALPALFARYPEMRLAVDPDELTAVPSIFSNSVTSLPVYLGPARD
jgi:2-hydroxy-5-methyl-1-naphthoate 7-hydroxylase